MLKKKKGAAHIILVCFLGLVLLFLYLLMGLTQLQLEYDTAILNEHVSDAILAADYMDQYLAAAYGYVVFDCSPTTQAHCDYDTCLYGKESEENAYNQAYTKARERFLDRLCESLSLLSDFSITKQTPCRIEQVVLNDFRTYNVAESIGGGLLNEGNTYMKTPESAQWVSHTIDLMAPNGDLVGTSGIYVDLEFTVRTFLKTTKIPVRKFVGIKK